MTCGSHVSVSGWWGFGKWKIASLLDYSIEFCSFLFLQSTKPSNLASKNKEAVGVALSH
jgi:hypothetical protein